MSRARSPLIHLIAVIVPLALATLVGVIGAAACGSTGTDTGLTPVTGVTVRAETLTAGHGCGTAATQLFKYAVVVFANGKYVAGNVNDCFTDGTFVNLPNIGTSLYTMDVYAYNEAAWVAQPKPSPAPSAGESTVTRINGYTALVADGGADRPPRDTILADLKPTNPTYTTTCTAQQLQLVQTLAACKPLQLGVSAFPVPEAGPAPTPTSVALSLATFPKGDGGSVKCDDEYVTVRSKLRVGTVDHPPTDTRCSALDKDTGKVQPVSITISPADAPASYVFTVTLLRADGATVGTTTCGADTSPGIASTAVCQPLP